MLGGRGRWLFFLSNTLKANSPATYGIIQDILRRAMLPANNVNSVVFDVIEDPAVGANNYILYPSNNANTVAGGGPRMSADSPSAANPIWLITLVCPSAAQIPYGVEPPPDNNEPAPPLVP